MKYLLWFFAGCICIGIPFFIGYDYHDMWNSVFGGMIGGSLFLILLYFFVVRKEFSARWKIFIAGLFTFHILAFAAFTVTSYRTTALQREGLYTVRSHSITMGIVGGVIYSKGWNMLHLYYELPAGEKKSFVEVFKTFYGEKIRNGILIESLNALQGTYVTFQGDSVVQLVYADSDAYTKGIRSDFENINGLTGKIQYSATISKHGVTYERNN